MFSDHTLLIRCAVLRCSRFYSLIIRFTIHQVILLSSSNSLSQSRHTQCRDIYNVLQLFFQRIQTRTHTLNSSTIHIQIEYHMYTLHILYMFFVSVCINDSEPFGNVLFCMLGLFHVRCCLARVGSVCCAVCCIMGVWIFVSTHRYHLRIMARLENFTITFTQ